MKHVKIGKKEYTIIESDELNSFLMKQQVLFNLISGNMEVIHRNLLGCEGDINSIMTINNFSSLTRVKCNCASIEIENFRKEL